MKMQLGYYPPGRSKIMRKYRAQLEKFKKNHISAIIGYSSDFIRPHLQSSTGEGGRGWKNTKINKPGRGAFIIHHCAKKKSGKKRQNLEKIQK